MKLVNFNLASSGHAVELRAFGLNWDLHNFANFVGLQLNPDSSAILTWVVPDEGNKWGDANNQYGGCRLKFCDTQRLSVTGRDVRMPASEDETLAEIAEMSPRSGLRFTFQSGLSVEIIAATAELIPIDRSAPAK
jgi:hypothetical protein